MKNNSNNSIFYELYQSLENTIGPTGWWPADNPFEVSIGAILTQNAPWNGVIKSICALKENGLFEPEIIAGADEKTIASLIRPSIYYNVKAKKLKTFCRFLVDNFDGDIMNLKKQGRKSARETLLGISGIGKETADSIIVYALGDPVFVIDAYTRRIFSRHNLSKNEDDYDMIQRIVEKSIHPHLYGEFHALLCLLGANICKKKPDCSKYPVQNILGEPTI